MNYLNNQRDKILDNFDEIMSEALVEKMPRYESVFRNSPKELKIIKSFFTEQKFNELRKNSIVGFFNGLNTMLESNQSFLIHNKFPVILSAVDMRHFNKNKIENTGYIQVTQDNINGNHDEMFEVIKKNILYFPFHYDILNAIKRTFSNGRYYEYEEIIEKYNFNKTPFNKGFLVTEIDDLYNDEGKTCSKALSLLENVDKERRAIAANSNNKYYVKKLMEDKIKEISLTELLKILEIQYGNESGYKKNEEISKEFDSALFRRLMQEFCQENVYKKMTRKTFLNIAISNIVEMNDMYKDIVQENVNQSEESVFHECFEAFVEIFMNDFIKTGHKNLLLELRSAANNEDIVLIIDKMIEKYKIENGKRQLDDNVIIIDDDGVLSIQLPDDFYSCLEGNRAIAFHRLFNISNEHGFIKENLREKSLYINLVIDNNFKMDKMELIYDLCEYMNKHIEKLIGVENDIVHLLRYKGNRLRRETPKEDTVTVDDLFNEFTRKINLKNNMEQKINESSERNKRKI